MVVKYPHEKLDPKHVKDCRFDVLEFNNLIAGEQELTLLPSIVEHERLARLGVAKTLCYHKKYLSDEDLREGYDSILKQVEQGVLTWKDDLASHLHSHLDYRANVIIRDKLAKQDSNKPDKKNPTDRKNQSSEGDTKEKVYYCLEFNLGKCPHPDNHKGWLGKRKVTKFHICKKCHTDGEF